MVGQDVKPRVSVTFELNVADASALLDILKKSEIRREVETLLRVATTTLSRQRDKLPVLWGALDELNMRIGVACDGVFPANCEEQGRSAKSEDAVTVDATPQARGEEVTE